MSSSEADQNNNEAKAVDLKNLGNDQLKIGHFLQAIGFYSEALEFSPTNAIILSNRAQAYIKVENYGLAMADATAALESNPDYAKAYYRRGSSQFALGHLKDARKDFRTVCVLNPKSKDARAKLKACEKAIRQAAFRKAIESEMTAPLSESYDPNSITINDSYDGPNPLVTGGPTDDADLEVSLFQPGKLPREFVLVSTILRSRIHDIVTFFPGEKNCIRTPSKLIWKAFRLFLCFFPHAVEGLPIFFFSVF